MPGRETSYGRGAGLDGQALVEAALVLPLLLFLALAVVGIGRVIQAQMGVSAVAREAAREAALAQTATEAGRQGVARGLEVASEYGLSNGTLALTVDPEPFVRGGQVQASARYQVPLGDLPLLGWVHLTVSSTHGERIELYRSLWPGGG